MKLEDRPHPLTDAFSTLELFIGDDDESPHKASDYDKLLASHKSLEQRLAHAVEALQSISEYWNGSSNERAMTDACEHNRELAAQALAEIEAAK